jgi:hypothetical protein
VENCDRAPDDQYHHHHRRDGHDLQRLLARFVNALDVFPPKVHGHGDRKERCASVFWKPEMRVRVL